MSERHEPHSLDAERAVLGSVLIKPQAWAVISSMLVADAFYLPAHREIWDGMAAIEKRQLAIDPVMIADELRARGALSRLQGGEAYLLELASSVPHAENVEHYARVVLDNFNKRKVLQLCALTQSRCYNEALTADELIEGLAGDLSKVVKETGKEPQRIGQVVPLAMAEIERRAAAGPEQSFSGMHTGVRALDEITWGWEAPDLVVIGADPGGGKTALALQAALIMTIEHGWAGFVANLEMSKLQITERALAHRARINSYLLRRGDLKLEDSKDLFAAARELDPADLYPVDDIATMREYELRLRIWRAKHPKKKAFGIFDYIQLAEEGGDSRQNRSQQVGGYARRLKKLAKDLDMVQIAISSLNRDQKDASEKPPTMKNLKESGDVEYAADTVHLLWNPHQVEDGQIEIYTPKNRKGPKRTVPAWFRGKHYAFLDVYDGEPPQQQTSLL